METNILQSEQVKKGLVATLILLCIFLASKTITEVLKYESADNEIAYNSISVNGIGEEFQVADIASFSFNIEEESPTLPEAQKKATEKGNATLKYLKDNGIDPKDIKTTYYNAGPKQEYQASPCTPYSCPPGKSVITGYLVSHQVSVKVRNAEKAGGLLSAIGEMGVSNLSSLQFVVDDEEALKTKARERAIKDAQEKARKLAKDLGVKLGDVVNFYENTGPYPMYDRAEAGGFGGVMSAKASNAPEISRGENKVSVNVSVTYRIK